MDVSSIKATMTKVALLRGGAWIEMATVDGIKGLVEVALLRGGAWIEMAVAPLNTSLAPCRTPSRGCVD